MFLSHKDPRTPASSRSVTTHIPYQGALEDELTQSWSSAFITLRRFMRHPDWIEQLRAAMDMGHDPAQAFVSAWIDSALTLFHSAAQDVISRRMEQTARMPILKAGAAAPASPQPSPRPRRSIYRRVPFPRLHIAPAGFSEPPSQHYASAAHIDAARTLTARLVTHVGDTTKARIRTAITQSIQKGINADITGKRIANMVGLFPRWQIAVDNLHSRMLANGISANIADQRAADYADELLTKRGLMIARTELMRATNEGRLAAMVDTAAQGGFDPGGVVKVWVSAPNACPECSYMGDPDSVGDDRHGAAVVGLDTPFDTPFGAITVPPLHPHCRCTVNYLLPDPHTDAETPPAEGE